MDTRTPIFDAVVRDTKIDVETIMKREKWSFAETNARIMKEINRRKRDKNGRFVK